jgi:hypothetical protein
MVVMASLRMTILIEDEDSFWGCLFNDGIYRSLYTLGTDTIFVSALTGFQLWVSRFQSRTTI